jgi:outer membrane protein TolC
MQIAEEKIMANPDLEAEIKEIESQLENMKQQRTTRNSKVKGKAGATQQRPQPESGGANSNEELTLLETMLAEFDAEEVIDTLSTHAKEWLGALNEDLKHTKPSTLLTVFGLGVIVGRLTK